ASTWLPMKDCVSCLDETNESLGGSAQLFTFPGLWHVSREVDKDLGNLPGGQFLADYLVEGTRPDFLAAPHNLPLARGKAVRGETKCVHVVCFHWFTLAIIFHFASRR